MDIVTQMQDQVNHIASLFFNHVGSLQRDAPPAPLAKKAKHEQATEAPPPGAGQAEPMAAAVLQAAKVGLESFLWRRNALPRLPLLREKLDELIAACPPTAQGEQAQLARIRELQDESNALGKELSDEIEAAEADCEDIGAMFLAAADDCLPTITNVANMPSIERTRNKKLLDMKGSSGNLPLT